ncbi:MAG: OmpA family protein [Nitrospinae bacterium]|nr:OmpA family protein [Nitrospinota bacterium]
MAKVKIKKVPKPKDGFIVLFTALSMIMLAFFILLVAISVPNATKKVMLQRGLKGSFGNLQTGSALQITQGTFLLNLPALTKDSQEMMFILKQLDGYITQNNLGDDITLYEDDRGLVFMIKDTLMFPPGQVKINKRVFPILSKIAEIIKESKRHVYVEGHTDNTEMHSARYPSNWELSASRAVNTILYFIKEGVKPERMAAAGFADTKPIFTNKTSIGRATNRRIEIVLTSTKI